VEGKPSVVALRAVEINVADLDGASGFYTDVWALEPVARTNGAHYFRASGPEDHVLIVRSDASLELGISAIELAVSEPAEVEQLHARLTAAGRRVDDGPRQLSTPGGGFGFAAYDGSGRRWNFSSGVEQHADGASSPDRPFKLSHVVLNSANIADDLNFAVDHLGFRQRDESKSMVFLGCNSDHHSLAYAKLGQATLNHIAYEVPTLDAVMRNAGRLKRKGHPMQWGVGRHGPGDNVYSYFLDPENVPIEYTAEVLQVDDATYRPGTPRDWDRPPFWDAWGLADPPTPRLLEALSGSHVPVNPRRAI
jgi:catechol 2,3-dioxygenase